VTILAESGLAGLLLALATTALNPAEDLARRVEARHRGLQDLTARFVQTYRSGVLGREMVEKGTVSIKPPGRMLWEYRDPEKKTFVSDGNTFYFYVPSDRQVIVREQAGDRGMLGRLLSGQEILGQFHAALETGGGGRPRLRLTPRRADPDVDRVYIEADARDRIETIEIVDTQGNRSRFRFENIRENLGLPDRLFHFKIPAGVEVVSG